MTEQHQITVTFEGLEAIIVAAGTLTFLQKAMAAAFEADHPGKTLDASLPVKAAVEIATRALQKVDFATLSPKLRHLTEAGALAAQDLLKNSS